MNFIRWCILTFVLMCSAAWADSTTENSIALVNPYRINASVINLPGTNQYTGGDPTQSIRQAAATLQHQGTSRTIWQYGGTTTATACNPDYTVITATTACYTERVRFPPWTLTDCNRRSSVASCAGSGWGTFVITLYNPPGAQWVTWNRGGETLPGNDSQGNAFSNNINKTEVSQAILREMLHVENVYSTDASCLSGPATNTALNKVFYKSRNALCEDEISALGSGYGGNPASDGFFANYIWKMTSSSYPLPAGFQWLAPAQLPSLDSSGVGIKNGLGGFDACRGADTSSNVTLLSRSRINALNHTVKENDYLANYYEWGGPFQSFRKPTITFDPNRKIWWAFGHKRDTNTLNVTYWTSTDRANWTERGLVRKVVGDYPVVGKCPSPAQAPGVAGYKCFSTCQYYMNSAQPPEITWMNADCVNPNPNVQAFQVPIETRQPVSASYDPWKHQIVVTFVDYNGAVTGDIIVGGSPRYGSGPSGQISVATMLADSDLTEARWLGYQSEEIAMWMNAITSGPIATVCDYGNGQGTFVYPHPICTTLYTNTTADRSLQSVDHNTSVLAAFPNYPTATHEYDISLPNKFVGGAGNGATFYPPALVRSYTGTPTPGTGAGATDKAVAAVLGTDGNIYTNTRDNDGNWGWWNMVSLPWGDQNPNGGAGGHLCNVGAPVFSGVPASWTGVGAYDMLFSADMCCEHGCSFP